MIVVKIELHSAVTGEVTELGRLHITNDGTGTPHRGHYDIARFGRQRRRVLQTARVEDWPRKSYNVFRLLRRALEALNV